MQEKTVSVGGQEVELTRDDLLIETAQSEGFETQSWGGVTVVLDKTLTPELIEEGFVREIVSKVQTMRKEAGFDVVNRIRLYIDGNEKLAEIIRKNEATIKHDVLCDEIRIGEMGGYTKEWQINTEHAALGVEKIG